MLEKRRVNCRCFTCGHRWISPQIVAPLHCPRPQCQSRMIAWHYGIPTEDVELPPFDEEPEA